MAEAGRGHGVDGGGQEAPASDRTPRKSRPHRWPRNEPPHARIYSHWVRSPAWATMTVFAKVLLTELLAEYRPKRRNLFPLPTRRAADLIGCAPNTAERAVGELVERKWIFVERAGGMTGVRATRARQVSLAMYDTETRKGDRDAAMAWEPP